MANKQQAKKRMRQDVKRNERNHSRINRIRTYVKKVEDAIKSNNYDNASQALKDAMPELHRGTTKGILHPNTVARKLSRLSKRVKNLAS